MVSSIYRLFGSKTRVSLLAELMRNPDRRYHVLELSRILKIPHTMLLKEIDNLELLGIINVEKIGKMKFVNANRSLPYFNQLRDILIRADGAKRAEVEAIGAKIVPLLKSNDVKRAAIFGSFATGTAKKDSDVDILVEFSRPKGLGFVSLKLALEKKLKREVDLLTYASINPYLRKRILGEAVRIL